MILKILIINLQLNKHDLANFLNQWNRKYIDAN